MMTYLNLINVKVRNYFKILYMYILISFLLFIIFQNVQLFISLVGLLFVVHIWYWICLGILEISKILIYFIWKKYHTIQILFLE